MTIMLRKEKRYGPLVVVADKVKVNHDTALRDLKLRAGWTLEEKVKHDKNSSDSLPKREVDN